MRPLGALGECRGAAAAVLAAARMAAHVRAPGLLFTLVRRVSLGSAAQLGRLGGKSASTLLIVIGSVHGSDRNKAC